MYTRYQLLKLTKFSNCVGGWHFHSMVFLLLVTHNILLQSVWPDSCFFFYVKFQRRIFTSSKLRYCFTVKKPVGYYEVAAQILYIRTQPPAFYLHKPANTKKVPSLCSEQLLLQNQFTSLPPSPQKKKRQ